MLEQFLATVKEEIEKTEPGDVDQCRLQIADILAEIERTGEPSRPHREQLLEALRKEDPDKVLAVIVRGNEENANTLRTLNDECRAVAQRQKRRRRPICAKDCLCSSIKKIPRRILSCCSQCCTDEQQPTEDQIEEEKQLIEILSNPLYISLEWLCRCYPTSSRNGSREGIASTSTTEDVIETALCNSHLLETIAGNDLHQHKDEYQERANEIEEFAIAVVEGTTRDQLIDIMDTKGEGCLKKQKPTNFSQSLNLIKIAADEKRKKVGEFLFVTAPCGKVF